MSRINVCKKPILYKCPIAVLLISVVDMNVCGYHFVANTVLKYHGITYTPQFQFHNHVDKPVQTGVDLGTDLNMGWTEQ